MAEITEALVLESLRGVLDPDTGRDIVSSGMVGGLMLRGGHVVFAIAVAPERGPKLEPLRLAAEKAVHALPGVVSVNAMLTAERAPQAASKGPAPTMPPSNRGSPTHAQHMRGEVTRPETPLMPGVAFVIAVASGKGGVGKSTTSVNLALALRDLGLAVGVFDADIYGPSQPRMLGVADAKPRTLGGKRVEPVTAHGLKVMSIGFVVPEDQPVVWRGPMVMGALEQLMRDVEWGVLDVLVVDMPPGTGDTQLTMTQRVPLAGVVIVSTPQDIALLDARKGLAMFRKVDVPVLGIIENMSTFVCPNCGHESHIFGHGGARREAEKLNTDFLGEIPLDIAIRVNSDDGTPIVVKEPDGPLAAAYRNVARQVWAKLQAGK